MLLWILFFFLPGDSLFVVRGDVPQLPDNQPLLVKIAYDVQEGLSNELFAR